MGSPKITLFTPFEKLSYLHSRTVQKFLVEQLDDFEVHTGGIEKAISYAMKEIPSHGGFVITLGPIDHLKGVAVVNKTGKSGYMAEYILVYLVIHKGYRNQGLGKALLKAVQEYCRGAIQIFLAPESPAKGFFEKLGYSIKGLEMWYSPS